MIPVTIRTQVFRDDLGGGRIFDVHIKVYSFGAKATRTDPEHGPVYDWEVRRNGKPVNLALTDDEKAGIGELVSDYEEDEPDRSEY